MPLPWARLHCRPTLRFTWIPKFWEHSLLDATEMLNPLFYYYLEKKKSVFFKFYATARLGRMKMSKPAVAIIKKHFWCPCITWNRNYLSLNSLPYTIVSCLQHTRQYSKMSMRVCQCCKQKPRPPSGSYLINVICSRCRAQSHGRYRRRFPSRRNSTPKDLWAKPQAGTASTCMMPSCSHGAASC